MIFMSRQFLKIAMFTTRPSTIRTPRTGVTVDWEGQQSVYRLALMGRVLMVLVYHTSPVYQFLSGCYERGRHAEMEWGWEFGSASCSPYRTIAEREWDRRSTFWRAVYREAFDRLWYPLVCRVRGHVYTSWADPESGYEEISCSRCGLSHSHYL